VESLPFEDESCLAVSVTVVQPEDVRSGLSAPISHLVHFGYPTTEPRRAVLRTHILCRTSLRGP
jgi:hypothetical protein